MSSATDYFTKVGSPGTATTLAAPGHTAGGTTLTVVSTSNWPTDTGVVFAVDTYTVVSGKAVRDVGSYCEFEGTVTNATTISGLVLRLGTDQNYPAGTTTRVYIPVAASRENRLVDGMLVSLDQDGTLKAGAVDGAAVLASDVVTTTKVANAAITSPKLKPTTGMVVDTVGLTLTTTPTDVTGATLSITPTTASVIDLDVFGQILANGVAATLSLVVDGAAVTPAIVVQNAGADNAGFNPSRPYQVNLTAAPHTIKLQAYKGVGGSASTAPFAVGSTGFKYTLWSQ